VRRAEHGESILKAAFNSAGEISVTIMSMTLSLGAVFIPLVFLPGLLGRIFREFSVTIIVAILASGLISLTLTPLMCARILGERKAGHKRARMEKWTSECIPQLQKSISSIPGITAVLQPNPVLQINVGATSQTQGQYAYTLSGIVPDEVYAAADQLMTKLKDFKGFASVRSDYYNSTPNLTVDIDRERAATYGVSTSAVQSLLRTAYSQNYVYLIKQPEDQYQVILEVKDNERAQPADLNNLYVRSNSGGSFSASGAGGGTITTTTGTAANLVPLRAVTSTKQIVGPQAVNHFNQFTSVTINFNLLPNVAIGDATKFIEDSFAQVHQQLPSVQATFQGEALVFRQLFKSLPLLLLSAIFVMYVILGILYESYVHPITVLFPAIVPAVVGGLFTLWAFGSSLSLYSVIGLFLLLGIVKKNGILVVDFALKRIDEGLSLREAIHEASLERFRPIMMTTLAALMGAVPLALGFGHDASARRPLGLVIVGGLIFSQMITLFVTPVIYLWLEWFQEHVLDKVPFLRSAHMHHEGEPKPGGDGEVREPMPAGAA